jgi:hypothetical protein
MKARMGIGFPSVEVNMEAHPSSDIAVYFVDDARNNFALGPHVAWRSDHNTQYM